jgi:hypothetical protein
MSVSLQLFPLGSHIVSAVKLNSFSISLMMKYEISLQIIICIHIHIEHDKVLIDDSYIYQAHLARTCWETCL